MESAPSSIPIRGLLTWSMTSNSFYRASRPLGATTLFSRPSSGLDCKRQPPFGGFSFMRRV